MKFILKSDLNLLLDEELVDQITCDKDKLLDQAELKALEEVRQWLSQRYDIDAELSSYTNYTTNVDYLDNQRIRVTQSDSNDFFGSTFGLDLISSGVTSEITSEFILAKKVNACPPQTLTHCDSLININLVNYALLDSRSSIELNNPSHTFTATNESFSTTCGVFSFSATTDGSTITQDEYEQLLTGGTPAIITAITSNTVETGRQLNYYNTVYASGTTSGGTITGETSVLDYNQENLVNGLDPTNFIDNINFFDQYLSVNEDRDWNIDDRNATLVDIVASITLYEITRRVAPRQMSETIADSYDLAIQKLKDANKGKIQLNIANKPCAERTQSGFGMRFGFNSSSFFNDY